VYLILSISKRVQLSEPKNGSNSFWLL
jgi:hypothetical protein